MNGPRVLLLGATGTIGRATASELVGRGVELTCLVRDGASVDGLPAGGPIRTGEPAHPDLSGQGFELMGGRLLPDAQGKSAQLMYENAATKERVTVYLRKPDADAPTTFRYVQQGEVGLFYWVEPGIGCALVGKLPKERLLALAQAVYRQHEEPAAASAPAR